MEVRELTKLLRKYKYVEDINNTDLAKMMNISTSTMYDKMGCPDRFTIHDLNILIKTLHIDKDELWDIISK